MEFEAMPIESDSDGELDRKEDGLESELTEITNDEVYQPSGGLLRLFQSELFNAWMAMTYLLRHDEVGVQYYLCSRMRDLPIEDILFFLPQLCHLAVTREDASTPVESLLMELCRRSLHASVALLWLLEAYIEDFGRVRDTQALKRTVRLLKEVQRASFGAQVGHAGSTRRRRSILDDREQFGGVDELPSVRGTLVGFGAALAAFGVPQAALAVKPLVLLEARTLHYADVDLGGRNSGILRRRPKSRPAIPSPPMPVAGLNVPKDSHLQGAPFAVASPSLDDLHRGHAFTLKGVMSHLQQPRMLREDRTRNTVPLFYHAEMQFVGSLIDISNRICSVQPREARQKALQVELNLINHNLPAPLCLPFLCGCLEDNHHPRHHRIIRLPSADATILNSAERVPFLVFIEVVEGVDDDEFARICQEIPKEGAAVNEPITPIPAISDPGTRTPIKSALDMIEARTPTIPPSSPLPSASQPAIKHQSARLDHGERMRMAAIMLAQLNRQSMVIPTGSKQQTEISEIRKKLLQEMDEMERERILDASISHGEQVPTLGDIDLGERQSLDPSILRDDPSAVVFREGFEGKTARIRQSSPFGHLPGWRLLSVIVKAGAEMRQEQLACQLIREMAVIWKEEAVECWVSPHHAILCASPGGGMIETIPDTLSIHSIRKSGLAEGEGVGFLTLREHFLRSFGDTQEEPFKNALDAFIASLAGYSLVTYLLQVKDRHNGNLLVDVQGHLVHIDFGFILSNVPGGGYVGGFEAAPFKLTADFLELLASSNNGISEPFYSPRPYQMTDGFVQFRRLIISGFRALRKHHERLETLIGGVAPKSALPCFTAAGKYPVDPQAALGPLRQRLALNMTDKQVEQHVDRLIAASANNMYTRLYDTFQYYSNGIL